MIKNISISILLLTFFSCSEKGPNPIAENPIPIIEFVDIQPKMVKEFEDSIMITLKYKDGDGDLGHKDPDQKLLSIRDGRLTQTDAYYIPPLAPTAATISIDGELRIKIKNTFLLGVGGDETTFYEIRIRDRAGNNSNYIKTTPITIHQ